MPNPCRVSDGPANLAHLDIYSAVAPPPQRLPRLGFFFAFARCPRRPQRPQDGGRVCSRRGQITSIFIQKREGSRLSPLVAKKPDGRAFNARPTGGR